MSAAFKLVRLANGAHAVYAAEYDEKMHPGLGPAAEADLLYVRQFKLVERMRATTGEFVVWDIGLGAAANAVAVLRATRELTQPLRLISFDNTAAPLAFALENADALGYLHGYGEQLRRLLEQRQLRFTDGAHEVAWEFHCGDFPAWLSVTAEISPGVRPSSGAAISEHPTTLKSAVAPCHHVAAPGTGALRPDRTPHAILFDAFSPAKNPAMWTLPLFANLFNALKPERPCALTTYSRSTMFRVTLLLAGFHVGSGAATGMKEETTIAANTPTLIDAPLDRRWLERAQRSDSAEPLHTPVYTRARLAAATWERLRQHPQFQ